ncbi:MAG TPA: hypothetical protein VF453_11335 [Burkholderiaceae bacterium]
MLPKPLRATSLACLAALAACGGGGGSPAAPAPDTHAITITGQPVAATPAADGSQTWSVTASSDIALSYQWAIDGRAVAGATSPSFTMTPALSDDGEQVSVTVSNSATSVVSAAVTVSVAAVTGLNVFAGRIGGAGYVDGAASVARLGHVEQGWSASALGTDGAGDLLVVDPSNFVVRRVTPAGVVSTVAGVAGHWGSTDGPVASALFPSASGVVADAAGNVYVSTYREIRKITPAGVSTLAGSESTSREVDGTGAAAGFDAVLGLAIDPAGNLYAADFAASIRKITPAGVVTSYYDASKHPGQRSFQSMVFGADGNLYAVDAMSDALVKISPAGVITNVAGGIVDNPDGSVSVGPFGGQSDLAIGADGVLTSFNLGSATTPPTMTRVAADGTTSTVALDLPDNDRVGGAVAFGPGFALLDQTQGAVYLVDTSGKATLFVGQPPRSGNVDGRGGAATFDRPGKVVVDAAGNAYVLETDGYATNHTVVRKVATDGTVSTVFASEDWYGAIAVDAGGQLYGTQYDEVDKLNPDNTATVVVDRSQLAAAGGSNPFPALRDLALAPDGHLLACTDAGLFSVAVAARTVAALNAVANCGAVAATASGRIYELQTVYATTAAADSVLLLDATTPGTPTLVAGGTVGYADGTGAAAAFGDFQLGADATGDTVRGRVALSADEDGNLYMVDPDNHAVRMITPAGVVTTLAGGPTTISQVVTGATAGLDYPGGVAPLPGTGGRQLFITDTYEPSLLVLRRP